MLLPLNHWRVHRAETQAGIENALRRDVDGSGVSVGTLKAPGDVTLACPVLRHTHTHTHTHTRVIAQHFSSSPFTFKPYAVLKILYLI